MTPMTTRGTDAWRDEVLAWVAESRYAGTGSSARSSPKSADATASRARARPAAAPRSEPASSAS